VAAVSARVTIAAAMVCLAFAGTASAQRTSADGDARRHLDEGERLYSELDFVAAIEALRRALGVSGISDGLRLEAYEYLGAAYVVLEDEDSAREAFLAMLELDPYHIVREPSGSPKIARFVEGVRNRVVSDAALDPSVRLRLELPRAVRVREETVVAARIEGRSSIALLRLFFRGEADTEWRSVDADDVSAVVLPAQDVVEELELYVEARDANGRLVTRAGEPYAPLTVRVQSGPVDDGGSFLESWWFWTAIGGAVTVGIVLGILASTSSSAPNGTLAPGRVELP
jgi:hypothetical protein